MIPVLSLFGLALLGSADDATTSVDRLHRALEERDRAAVVEAVTGTHAWEVLADSVAGETSVEDPVRGELIAALAELVTTRRMATLPEGAHFGKCEAVAVDIGKDTELWVVKSSLVEDDGDVEPLSYHLAQADGEWLIVDAFQGESPLLSLADEFADARSSAAGLVAAIQAAEARYHEEASAVVARLQAGLIDAMKREGPSGLRDRVALLEPLITDTHDLDAIVRLSVGRRWDEATAEQQGELRKLFRELSVATYASRFHEHKGESFGVLGEEPTRRGGIIVASRLTKANGETVSFDYQMRRAQGRWKILNIVVDGASDLAIKRAEYGKVLDEGGFPGLITELGDQIRRYESGGSD